MFGGTAVMMEKARVSSGSRSEANNVKRVVPMLVVSGKFGAKAVMH